MPGVFQLPIAVNAHFLAVDFDFGKLLVHLFEFSGVKTSASFVSPASRASPFFPVINIEADFQNHRDDQTGNRFFERAGRKTGGQYRDMQDHNPAVRCDHQFPDI